MDVFYQGMSIFWIEGKKTIPRTPLVYMGPLVTFSFFFFGGGGEGAHIFPFFPNPDLLPEHASPNNKLADTLAAGKYFSPPTNRSSYPRHTRRSLIWTFTVPPPNLSFLTAHRDMPCCFMRVYMKINNHQYVGPSFQKKEKKITVIKFSRVHSHYPSMCRSGIPFLGSTIRGHFCSLWRFSWWGYTCERRLRLHHVFFLQRVMDGGPEKGPSCSLFCSRHPRSKIK